MDQHSANYDVVILHGVVRFLGQTKPDPSCRVNLELEPNLVRARVVLPRNFELSAVEDRFPHRRIDFHVNWGSLRCYGSRRGEVVGLAAVASVRVPCEVVWSVTVSVLVVRPNQVDLVARLRGQNEVCVCVCVCWNRRNRQSGEGFVGARRLILFIALGIFQERDEQSARCLCEALSEYILTAVFTLKS